MWIGSARTPFIALATWAAFASAVKPVCVYRGADMYSYCHSRPSAPSKCADGKYPTIIWLNGHGSFGEGQNLDTRAGMDGLGNVLYNQGHLLHSELVDNFVVIIPLNDDPTSQHYSPSKIDNVITAFNTGFPNLMDPNAVYFAGHSAGCRGSLRYAIETAGERKPVAMACGGGGAEKLPPGEANPPVNKDDQRYYGWRLVTDKSAAETFSKLSQMKNVPTWLFQGDQDEVAKGTIDMPSGAPEATAVELNKVGGNAQVKHFPGGHDAISRVPWDTPGFGQSVIDFFKASRRGGQCTPAARKLGRSAMWPGKDTLDAVSADDD